ncbi:hypothetical protein Bbelb_208840 [Branchiostoma belcheri]|nr:hypothetical protein Bbelb_208840 [Branchiostoma belcheri]
MQKGSTPMLCTDLLRDVFCSTAVFPAVSAALFVPAQTVNIISSHLNTCRVQHCGENRISFDARLVVDERLIAVRRKPRQAQSNADVFPVLIYTKQTRRKIPGGLLNQSEVDEEKKKQYNERKNAESQHNEEMATLTARCESLQSLAETQQQQIAELQREVSSLNISLALAKARSSTESLPCDNHPGTVQDSNSGNNSNKTVTTDTTEANADTQYANDKTEKVETHPDVEGTQPVRRHEEQPAQVEDSREIRIYTDSIWKAVNTARMFPRRSTSKVKASTISNATQQLKQVNDPGTVYAIFHVGSNDLDNSQHEDSSVEDCLKNTEELVSHAKASFPNATIVLSQVLPRGHDLHSNLNKNIKNYNQSVLQLTRDDDKIIYVRHKKLSTSRHLYKHDGIHLDDVTGTSLLVADVKQTLRTADAKQPPSTAEGTSRDNNQRPQEQARQGQRQTTQARPQDTYQPQYRAQDKAQRTRREEHRYRPEDWRRRPSGYQPQPQMPEQKIINLAYKLSELLSNF